MKLLLLLFLIGCVTTLDSANYEMPLSESEKYGVPYGDGPIEPLLSMQAGLSHFVEEHCNPYQFIGQATFKDGYRKIKSTLYYGCNIRSPDGSGTRIYIILGCHKPGDYVAQHEWFHWAAGSTGHTHRDTMRWIQGESSC
jgi:hypothetical protein